MHRWPRWYPPGTHTSSVPDGSSLFRVITLQLVRYRQLARTPKAGVVGSSPAPASVSELMGHDLGGAPARISRAASGCPWSGTV